MDYPVPMHIVYCREDLVHVVFCLPVGQFLAAFEHFTETFVSTELQKYVDVL